jgi:hypothetical protein
MATDVMSRICLDLLAGPRWPAGTRWLRFVSRLVRTPGASVSYDRGRSAAFATRQAEPASEQDVNMAVALGRSPRYPLLLCRLSPQTGRTVPNTSVAAPGSPLRTRPVTA